MPPNCPIAMAKLPSTTPSIAAASIGISSLRGYGTGDQNVKVIVEVPKKLTKKQKDLLKEFEKEGKKKGFFKKVFEQ